MLYTFFGNDWRKRQEKISKLVSDYEKKYPDLPIHRFDNLNFEDRALDELIESATLFGKMSLSILSGLVGNKETADEIISRLGRLAESKNVFFVNEEKLIKAVVDKLKRSSNNFYLFEKKTKPKDKFDSFSLSRALERRDKKNLWLLYAKTKDEGMSPEQISGLLFWKIKDLAIRGNSKYEKNELLKLSAKFVSAYHNGHRGFNMRAEIERVILEI